MRFPLRFWNAIGVLLATGVALLAVYLPGLTQDKQIAIIAFGNALIGVLITVTSEQNTTPLADPRLPAGSSYKITDPADSASVLDVRTVPNP